MWKNKSHESETESTESPTYNIHRSKNFIMATRSESKTEREVIDKPFALTGSEVLSKYGVDKEQGLTEEEVQSRRDKFGVNRLRQHKSRSIWSVLVAQFKSIIIGLLAVAAIAAFLYGEWVEGWAVLVVILINTLIGFVTELRAVRAMEALSKMGTVKTRVKRMMKWGVKPSSGL